MGIRGRVARSTLADANEHRDWRIFADFAQRAHRARLAHSIADEPFGLELQRRPSMPSTPPPSISVSRSFPGLTFRRHKSAVKLHTLLDLRGNIPSCLCAISAGKSTMSTSSTNCFRKPEPSIVMDRGYLDFARLYGSPKPALSSSPAPSKNTQFYRRQSSRPVDRSHWSALRPDHSPQRPQNVAVVSRAFCAAFAFVDAEPGKRFVFLTNNFLLAALTISQLYRAAGSVELFFNWLKQHLRIKAFYGTSPERRADPSLDRHQHLSAAWPSPRNSLRLDLSLYKILQMLQRHDLREKPDFRGAG